MLYYLVQYYFVGSRILPVIFGIMIQPNNLCLRLSWMQFRAILHTTLDRTPSR